MKGVELALIAACSNGVDAGTVQAVIQAESAGQALAIATNPARPLPKLTSSVDAAALLADLLARNISVDIWLMQVNSQHLQRFNVQASELLDPCVNIFVGTTILSEAYARAVAIHGPGQSAVLAALSIYNTGDPQAGFRNGYVQRVTGYSFADEERVGDQQARASPLQVPFDVPYGGINDAQYAEKLRAAFAATPSQ